MPSYAVQWTIFPTSNLNADASTNNWSFDATDVTALGGAITALRTFYSAVFSLYPSTVRQNNHTIKAYNRADPIPRAPVLSQVYNWASAPGGNPLAPEMSMVGSFQAPPLSGTPQARRRGRVFLGPLSVLVLDTAGRPSTAQRAVLRNALEALRVASVASPDWAWTVYSTVNNNSPEISNGWVDDEFDTQRRRGRLPTTRTVFP